MCVDGVEDDARLHFDPDDFGGRHLGACAWGEEGCQGVRVRDRVRVRDVVGDRDRVRIRDRPKDSDRVRVRCVPTQTTSLVAFGTAWLSPGGSGCRGSADRAEMHSFTGRAPPRKRDRERGAAALMARAERLYYYYTILLYYCYTLL